MPQKAQEDQKLIDNPIVKKIIYKFPNGEEYYKAAKAVQGQAEKHRDIIQPLTDKLKARAKHIVDDLRHRQRQEPQTQFLIDGLEGRLVAVDEAPQVGDLVVMTPEASAVYNYTKEGSYGILKELFTIDKQKRARIEFHHLAATSRYPLPITWRVDDDGCFKKAVLEDEVGQARTEHVIDEHVELKLNDKVRIKPTSQYTGQDLAEGQVIAIDPFNQDLPFIVKFQDGYQNSYSAEDLEAVVGKTKGAETTRREEVMRPRKGAVETQKTEVRYGIKGKKAAVHNKDCVHKGIAGLVCHYISKVSMDHLIGSAITAVLIYTETYVLDNHLRPWWNAQTESQSVQTVYAPKEPVVGPSIMIFANRNDTATNK